MSDLGHLDFLNSPDERLNATRQPDASYLPPWAKRQTVFIDWRDFRTAGPWPTRGDDVTIPEGAHPDFSGRRGVVLTARGAKQTVALDD